MKILRSVTRRGFNVGTAGWFTVLRPNTWSAASRLSDGLHSLGKGVAIPEGDNGGLGSTPLAKTVDLKPPDVGMARMALIASAACAITSILLWWIMHP